MSGFKKIGTYSGRSNPDKGYYYPQDSIHEVFDIGLKDGYVLHRFMNVVGDEISAIYKEDNEICWVYRKDEARMIEDQKKNIESLA